MRRARVRGSVTSPPSCDPGLGKEEPRRSRVGERVVPEGTTRVPGTSALTRRDVFCAFSRLCLRGSELLVEPVREGCCGGVRGGGNVEELLRCGAAGAAVL
jgi:hypothetical protein